MEITNDLYTAGAWAMMSVFLLISVSILLSRDFLCMSWSEPLRGLEINEEDRIPLLAQEEKSVQGILGINFSKSGLSEYFRYLEIRSK